MSVSCWCLRAGRCRRHRPPGEATVRPRPNRRLV